jgi:hypothetical protein
MKSLRQYERQDEQRISILLRITINWSADDSFPWKQSEQRCKMRDNLAEAAFLHDLTLEETIETSMPFSIAASGAS